MIHKKERPRSDWNSETRPSGKILGLSLSTFLSHFKALIVWLGVYDWLPAAVVSTIIDYAGVRHV